MPQFIQVLPGMRTLKTALAVLICIGIWRIWNDSMPFFASIAAVITMQNSIENSVKVGIDRVIETTLGIGIAVLVNTLIKPPKKST